MTDSLDTSGREAEDPCGPLILPVRDMRGEPVPHQPANPLRAALQLALEATPEELPAGLDALRGLLAAPQQSAPQALTDEQIDRVTDEQWGRGGNLPVHAAHRAYARAVIAEFCRINGFWEKPAPLTDEQWLKKWTRETGERIRPGGCRDELLEIFRFAERAHGIKEQP